MLVAEMLRVLKTRWRIVSLAIAVSIAAGVLTGLNIAPTYETSTSLLFLSPSTVTASDGNGSARRVNPYVNFTQDLAVAADIVRARVSGESAADSLRSAGLEGVYKIEPTPEALAPMLTVTLTAASPGAAAKGAGLVSDEIRAELRRQQEAAGAPTTSLITATVIAPPHKPTPVRKQQDQAALLATALTVVLCLLLLAADERRRSRRTDSGGASDAATAGQPMSGDFAGAQVGGQANLRGPAVGTSQPVADSMDGTFVSKEADLMVDSAPEVPPTKAMQLISGQPKAGHEPRSTFPPSN